MIFKSRVKITKYEPTPRIKQLIEKYSVKEKGLDAGCGTGAHLSYFKSDKVYAFDIIDSYVEFVKNKFKNNRCFYVRKADITKIPYKDNYFDFVLCVSVLEYLINQKDRYKAISEMKRVLKKGGIMVILVPHENILTRFIRKSVISKVIFKETNQPFSTMGIPIEIDELKKLGFTQIRGCLGWVTWKTFTNDLIPNIIDRIFWHFPVLSGSLIGIYEKK